MRRRSFIAIMVFSRALRLGPRQLANSRTHLKDPSMALQPLRASRTTYFIENHLRLTSVLAKWLSFYQPHSGMVKGWLKKFRRRLFRHLHNGPLFFKYHASWTVGSEGTTLTSGSIRVQRHPSQVSVRRGKFYLLTVTSYRVKFPPTYRDLGGVSLDFNWPTG